MNKLICILSLLSIYCLTIVGQSSTSLSQVKGDLDNMTMNQQLRDSRRHKLIEEKYRKPNFNEIETLSVSKESKQRFSNFLKQTNTGLVKLVTDSGCDEFSNKPQPDSGLCKQLPMHGGGSAYSFRRKDYQYWKLADLLYDGKSFLAFGEMSLGFLVNLGDINPDEVSPSTKGAAFVFNFVPKNDLQGSAEQNAQLVEGIEIDKFHYKKFLPIVEGNTYLLRSIAYNGKVIREEYGIKYNELSYDNRQDVIVAFKLIEQDSNGAVTILWKLLQAKKSPTLGNQ